MTISSNNHIKPFTSTACGCVTLPGSKSITNRAMLLAALSGGEIEICGALFSRDTLIMADCLKRLGYEVETDRNSKTVRVSSKSGVVPNSSAKLFVGNAGTAARFITALCAVNAGGEYSFDSDEEMYKRPMKGLMDALRAQGAEFEFMGQKDCFPFKMRAGGLKGGDIQIDASASSQLLSGLLMVLPFAKRKSAVKLSGQTVSKPFVDMTVSMMNSFGFICKAIGESSFEVDIARKNTSPKRYSVEPDATAASYFEILPALTGGAVFINEFASCALQGDYAFLPLLQSCGIVKARKVDGGMLVFKGDGLDKSASQTFHFNDISDTFLTLAAASAALGAKMKIDGISHTRAQETDRVSAMATELKKVCRQVEETADALEITPFDKPAESLAKERKSIEIKTYLDHRIAMSFAILGSANALESGLPWIALEDRQCVGKTWEDFFDVLDALRKNSAKKRVVAVDGGAAVGKSSVSKAVSKILGLMHVDTGSHYRTLTYGLLKAGLKPDDQSAVENYLTNLSTATALDKDNPNSARMTVCGELVDDAFLRTKEVNDNVSIFASMPCVRTFLKGYQRSMAQEALNRGFNGLIMEGRDIGSVIFPDASVRIFLDADEQTRAARRAKEGISDSIAARDKLDKTRKTAPLVCPKGAISIDTSHLTKDEVVAKAVSEICKSKADSYPQSSSI